MTANTTSASFLEFSREKLLNQYWPRMQSCVESLTDEQIWWRPNEASNSVGNLVLHLNGNMRQWLIDSFNRCENHRNRPAEFREETQSPGSMLLDQLGKTVAEAGATLSRLTEADLLADYDIQGYERVTGLRAVYQVIEHFGLHYGQIVYITKMLCAKDLGFYRELSQTGYSPRSVGHKY